MSKLFDMLPADRKDLIVSGLDQNIINEQSTNAPETQPKNANIFKSAPRTEYILVITH